MDTEEDSPVFGKVVPYCPYVLRPSAYALVRNMDNEIAAVRTPLGYFLPGGGIEGTEDPGHAIVREALEECGLNLSLLRYVGRATEIVYSPTEHTCFEKDCIFPEACVNGVSSPRDTDHELVWLAPSEASYKLSHESHRWAVQRIKTTT